MKKAVSGQRSGVSKEGTSRPLRVASQTAEGGRQKAEGQSNPRKPSTFHSPLPTYRLFYALRVPTEVSGELAQVQQQLRGNWRAVNPGQMHVTLSYLPSVPPGRVDDLKRLGAQLTRDLPPMPVRLRGTGYFPNEGSPRVWFVKVEAEGLTELAARLRAGLQALELETDDLPFKAHITLARKKGPAPRVPPQVFDHLGWTASGAALYRSILRKTGPIYEVESTFRFRGTEPPPPLSPLKGESEQRENQPDQQEYPDQQDIKEQP